MVPWRVGRSHVLKAVNHVRATLIRADDEFEKPAFELE